jgi:uncharacterized membrane protein
MLMSFFSGSSTPLIAVAAILILLLIVLSIRRRREEPPFGGAGGESGKPAPDRSDGRYWKAGIFYVNPGDPAVFVKKRFGFGWTLNFGHWISWVIMAVPVFAAFLGKFLAARH